LRAHSPVAATGEPIVHQDFDSAGIFARLKPLLLQNLGVSEEAIKDGDMALLGENSGIDSVGVLRLVMALEKEFDIVIGDADITPANLETLKGLIALVQQKMR
jgi:acyl carrier protein